MKSNHKSKIIDELFNITKEEYEKELQIQIVDMFVGSIKLKLHICETLKGIPLVYIYGDKYQDYYGMIPSVNDLKVLHSFIEQIVLSGNKRKIKWH